MKEITAARVRNRKALAGFIVVVLVGAFLVEEYVFNQQRLELATQNHDDLQTEIILLGELSKDALLRSDYAVVEDLANRWLDRHPYLVKITAVMPNGFVLVDAGRMDPDVELLTVRHDVVFNEKILMTLSAVADFSGEDVAFAAIRYKGGMIVGIMILCMGGLLWWILQRISILPLELEVQQKINNEQELMKRTRELEAAINELESFSYSVSHDLRAPLRAIDGYGHALNEDYGHVMDDTARGYIARSRAAARRMGEVIDGLLNLSRISRHMVSSAEVNLSRLVSEDLERLRETDPDRQVEIHIAENVRVRGDAVLLNIAIDNLLRNAWVYTSKQEQALIEFGTRMQAGETTYFIKDNGVGFDMQYAQKLFESFQRMHSAEEFPGSGIGLAIVARIIKIHGGRIWAEAEPGKGATFFFTLAG